MHLIHMLRWLHRPLQSTEREKEVTPTQQAGLSYFK